MHLHGNFVYLCYADDLNGGQYHSIDQNSDFFFKFTYQSIDIYQSIVSTLKIYFKQNQSKVILFKMVILHFACTISRKLLTVSSFWKFLTSCAVNECT